MKIGNCSPFPSVDFPHSWGKEHASCLWGKCPQDAVLWSSVLHASCRGGLPAWMLGQCRRERLPLDAPGSRAQSTVGELVLSVSVSFLTAVLSPSCRHHLLPREGQQEPLHSLATPTLLPLLDCYPNGSSLCLPSLQTF